MGKCFLLLGSGFAGSGTLIEKEKEVFFSKWRNGYARRMELLLLNVPKKFHSAAFISKDGLLRT